MGSRWARLVNSGSSANLLAVQALTQPEHGDRRLPARRSLGEGGRPGDEVLTVAAAFPTTVAPIVQAGAGLARATAAPQNRRRAAANALGAEGPTEA